MKMTSKQFHKNNLFSRQSDDKHMKLCFKRFGNGVRSFLFSILGGLFVDVFACFIHRPTKV